MSEPKFTKGEWLVTKWNGDSWPDKRVGVSKQDNDMSKSIVICPRYADIHSEEILANMNLIAAAPDLYYALEHLAKSHKIHFGLDGAWDVALINAESVLAKARGEQ